MKHRKWKILNKFAVRSSKFEVGKLINVLLKNRGITTKKDREKFINPPDPYTLTVKDVGIDGGLLVKAFARIRKAIEKKESIVVYADYDADGITAGTIMWKALHQLGANIMPYVPHRVDEGYGFSIKGIDKVKEKHNPTLIISVDHGITAFEKIEYAKQLGIDVIVTDHHVKPAKVPDCIIVHTTQLCGAGVAWFVVKELLSLESSAYSQQQKNEILALAAIGTIGDMVPLVGANRAIVKSGLAALNLTTSVGLEALFQTSGIVKGKLGVYDVSYILVPRLNAMGRLVHALDVLRLLCTSDKNRARQLAETLGITNRERQQLTLDTTIHAKEFVDLQVKNHALGKLLLVSHAEYNQGVIGLVAGKLVEKYYRPAIVIACGATISKASARSISGFNIIEAIRSCSDLLIDAGGHPMAAGFTIETTQIAALEKRLLELAEKTLDAEKLTPVLTIDARLQFANITSHLYQSIQQLAPFGMSNPDPIFVSHNVGIADARLVGREGKHLKLQLFVGDATLEAIGFGMGEIFTQIKSGQLVDVAYTIAINEWNGSERLQLKLKDINLHLSINQVQ